MHNFRSVQTSILIDDPMKGFMNEISACSFFWLYGPDLLVRVRQRSIRQLQSSCTFHPDPV